MVCRKDYLMPLSFASGNLTLSRLDFPVLVSLVHTTGTLGFTRLYNIVTRFIYRLWSFSAWHQIPGSSAHALAEPCILVNCSVELVCPLVRPRDNCSVTSLLYSAPSLATCVGQRTGRVCLTLELNQLTVIVLRVLSRTISTEI